MIIPSLIEWVSVALPAIALRMESSTIHLMNFQSEEQENHEKHLFTVGRLTRAPAKSTQRQTKEANFDERPPNILPIRSRLVWLLETRTNYKLDVTVFVFFFCCNSDNTLCV